MSFFALAKNISPTVELLFVFCLCISTSFDFSSNAISTSERDDLMINSLSTNLYSFVLVNIRKTHTIVQFLYAEYDYYQLLVRMYAYKQYIILQNMQEILVHYIDNQYVTTILETKLLHNL